MLFTFQADDLHAVLLEALEQDAVHGVGVARRAVTVQHEGAPRAAVRYTRLELLALHRRRQLDLARG